MPKSPSYPVSKLRVERPLNLKGVSVFRNQRGEFQNDKHYIIFSPICKQREKIRKYKGKDETKEKSQKGEQEQKRVMGGRRMKC